jgi:hypothetical protein
MNTRKTRRGVMGENMWRKKLELLKKRIKEKFIHLAEPMKQVDYTRENYDKLFPDSKVKTPLGEYTLRDDQFEKLKRKDRQNFLGAMHQTLTEPVVIINENRDGEISKVFGKSFIDNLPDKSILMSVINQKNKGVTTHARRINNFINKIKNPSDLLYEKQIRGFGTARNDPDSLNLAISDDTQLPNNIPQPAHNVNEKNDKTKRESNGRK